MSLREVLGVTKRQFFWMLRQAERLEAEADRRHLSLLLAVASQDGVGQALSALDADIGVIYEWSKPAPLNLDKIDDEGLDPDFDRAGLRALKQRHGA
jgi:hypothetical protein